MTTWHDVGGNPAPGRPDQIRSVANHFGELSVAARLARRQLAALQRGELRACWTGVAADAFASELEILPADLGKLETSLDHASTAVHRWAGTVDQAQDRAERELREYGGAEQQLRTARYERDREREALINEGLIDPVGAIGDVLSGNNRLAPYERRVDDAHDQVRRIQNHIDQIREDVDATARTIANLLHEASRLGIQNKDFFQKLGDFLTELGEALVVVLRFLDELVDLIAPWVGIALLILSFVNPVFALVAVGFAALDFGLTASRAILGDDEVTALDLLDDGVDLALALVGAKGANAGLGVVDDFGRAAKSGKLIKATDTVLNVVGGAKIVGDYYLNLGGIIGVGPGSTFDLVVDVSSGDTSSWAPGEGPAYGSDFVEATGGLVDLVTGDSGAMSGGSGDGVVPGPGDGGGAGVVPGPGDGGGGGDGVVPGPGDGVVPGPGGGAGVVPGPGDGGLPGPGVVPGPGDGVVPGPGDGGGAGVVPSPGDGGGAGVMTGDDFGSGSQRSGSGLIADGPTISADAGVGSASPSSQSDFSGLVPDSGRPADSTSFEVLTPNNAPTSGLVPDSPPAPAPGQAAAVAPQALTGEVGTRGATGDGLKIGAIASAAAVGLGGAVAGAKRLIDKKTDASNKPGGSETAARQALIGTSEFVLSDIVESPVEVARLDVEEGQDDE